MSGLTKKAVAISSMMGENQLHLESCPERHDYICICQLSFTI